MASRKSERDPEPRLPIKLAPVSNGEFIPEARPEVAAAAARARAAIDENARRAGVSRRELLATACGAATTLAALNSLGCGGGRYDIPKNAGVDPAIAKTALGGAGEVVFDVQTHHVNPTRDWFKINRAFDFLRVTWAECRRPDWIECYGSDEFVKEIFLDSDTDIAILSSLAGDEKINPLLIDEAAETRRAVEKLGRGERLLLHGIVMPNLGVERQLDWMQQLVEKWKVSAFKLYTVWGPQGRGWMLDDPKLGIPVIEKARALGVRKIAIHKGVPLPGMDPTFTRPRDVGVVARMFPDVTFLIYHSGYEHALREGPYDPANAEAGVNALIKSLKDNGIGPNGNVAAELGAVWQAVMTRPDEAAHVLGKLLVHVGEDRVVWGTDCIWFGSPQDQIQALRAFEISKDFQERFGYPALTPEIKAKIFAKNGASLYGVDLSKIVARRWSDDLGRAKAAYLERPSPSHLAYGPRSRRELFELLRRGRGMP
jgi:predicted TIM-barrel fold metal-dependent hydrolase